MLDYSSLRNVFKATDRINSKHLVLAEWNMNKYQTIEKYGVYVPTPHLRHRIPLPMEIYLQEKTI